MSSAQARFWLGHSLTEGAVLEKRVDANGSQKFIPMWKVLRQLQMKIYETVPSYLVECIAPDELKNKLGIPSDPSAQFVLRAVNDTKARFQQRMIVLHEYSLHKALLKSSDTKLQSLALPIVAHEHLGADYYVNQVMRVCAYALPDSAINLSSDPSGPQCIETVASTDMSKLDAATLERWLHSLQDLCRFLVENHLCTSGISPANLVVFSSGTPPERHVTLIGTDIMPVPRGTPVDRYMLQPLVMQYLPPAVFKTLWKDRKLLPFHPSFDWQMAFLSLSLHSWQNFTCSNESWEKHADNLTALREHMTVSLSQGPAWKSWSSLAHGALGQKLTDGREALLERMKEKTEKNNDEDAKPLHELILDREDEAEKASTALPLPSDDSETFSLIVSTDAKSGTAGTNVLTRWIPKRWWGSEQQEPEVSEPESDDESEPEEVVIMSENTPELATEFNTQAQLMDPSAEETTVKMLISSEQSENFSLHQPIPFLQCLTSVIDNFSLLTNCATGYQGITDKLHQTFPKATISEFCTVFSDLLTKLTLQSVSFLVLNRKPGRFWGYTESLQCIASDAAIDIRKHAPGDEAYVLLVVEIDRVNGLFTTIRPTQYSFHQLSLYQGVLSSKEDKNILSKGAVAELNRVLGKWH